MSETFHACARTLGCIFARNHLGECSPLSGYTPIAINVTTDPPSPAGAGETPTGLSHRETLDVLAEVDDSHDEIAALRARLAAAERERDEAYQQVQAQHDRADAADRECGLANEARLAAESHATALAGQLEAMRETVWHADLCVGLADNEIAHGRYTGTVAMDVRRARDFLAKARTALASLSPLPTSPTPTPET